MRKRIRILIADHEAIFRIGLRRLFAVEEDLHVISEAEDADQAVRLASRLKPDLAFVQAEIFAQDSSDFIARIRRASPNCRVVVTINSLQDGEAIRFTKSGASGVILKSVHPDLFTRCARKVMDNEVWLPKADVAKMARILETSPDHMPRPAETLTHREKMVISYLVEGLRNREIAEQLSISEQTVKNHLRAVYDKVGVSDRLELVLYTLHHHLDLPPVRVVEAVNS
ncbi:MAG TPA: response regulator transcription factor [Terriglobia bacterium]|nr:response regulator transcription factor [Terriglobia bacterium]